MKKIISSALRQFPLGLYTRGDASTIPIGACVELLNLIYRYEVWVRKGGRAKYNSTYMHATEEVRGGFVYNDGTTYAIVSVCNSSLYATTGDGSMGSALTAPDAAAVTFTDGDRDIYAAQYMNRLHFVNGDATDYLLVYESNGNIIDYSRADYYGSSDAGFGWAAIDATNGTTTIDDATLTEADDYWIGLPVYVRDATDGQFHKTYITDFDAANDRITLEEAPSWTITTSDEYHIGSWDDYDDGVTQHSYPKGLKFLTAHMDRLFGAVGSTLYWTDLFDSDRWNPKVGVNYRYIGRDDDDQDITGIASLDDKIVIFKPHNIYVIRTVGDKDEAWITIKITGADSDKGCVWHKTLKRGFGGLIYMSWNGVYVLPRNLNIHCVSRNIKPTIIALAQSISNPNVSFSEFIDTSKADFEAGETQTKIDTATVAGTFRVDLTTEAVDATYSTGGDEDLSNYGKILAQSFKPTIDCICTKIQLYIKGYDTTNIVYVYLRADDNNMPGDTLASASATNVGTSYTWTDFNITDTNLTADTKYWIEVYHAGSSSNTIYWQIDGSDASYANGNLYYNATHYTTKDTYFKIYEQHYEATSEFISQIFDLGATPTGWGQFKVTAVLNGCLIAWYVRADDKSDMSDNPTWVAIEPGAVIACDLERYFEYRGVPTPTNIATPVVEDVTIRAFVGTITAPCAYVWKKAYWLSVQDAGSTVNNCVYWLDEEAVMYEGYERWSKLDGIYANQFLDYNDQLLSTSVGGTGKGGFLYYEDTGTKDLGSDFTARLITRDEDYGTVEHPEFRDKEKVYKKIYSKYVSQQPASLYYRVESGDWSSAITLPAHADVDIERDFFDGVQRGERSSLKWEQTVADPDLELHGWDIVYLLAKLR